MDMSTPPSLGPGLGARPRLRVVTLLTGMIGREVSYMSQVFRVKLATVFAGVLLGGTLSEVSARPRLYPLTQCGPDLDYLCPIHGYFDSVPFHYNLAIYPGCLRRERVETPRGIRRRLIQVCG